MIIIPCLDPFDFAATHLPKRRNGNNGSWHSTEIPAVTKPHHPPFIGAVSTWNFRTVEAPTPSPEPASSAARAAPFK